MSNSMLPTSPGGGVEETSSDFVFHTEPSYTYKLAAKHDTIVGHTDGLDAYKQAIYKILNTERYKYVIYSWNYGVELSDLIGKPVYYVVPEIERRITEAVSQDDRTLSVSGFEFDTSKRGVVHVKFTVTSIYGREEIEKDVEYV